MKGFFRNFTGALYDFNTLNFKSRRAVIDITRSIQFKDIGDVVRYDKYYITDKETPDNLAYKLYGDATKHWIFYLLNPNLKEGWPYSDQEIERFIENKYGSYSFLAFANEDVYSIDFTGVDASSVEFYLDPNSEPLDISLYQFDYSRRAFIISQKPDDTEWMTSLETIYIQLPNISNKISLMVNSNNCRYLMKNAIHSYSSKSYRDALENEDTSLNAITFEEYEIQINERKKFIRVLNTNDAEKVSQQYFDILNNG